MKVLLSQDIEKLGWLGDVVEVKDGYARNYLIPHGLAVVPTEANIKSLAEAKVKSVETRQLAREQMERAVEAVGQAEAVIAAKANEQGHLFGSVNEDQIAENLRQQGFEVPTKAVKLSEHIKEIGSYEVKLQFASDLTTNVKVVVVAQEDSVETTEEDK